MAGNVLVNALIVVETIVGWLDVKDRVNLVIVVVGVVVVVDAVNESMYGVNFVIGVPVVFVVVVVVGSM